MDSTKDDLKDARDHAKSALTATLRAVRGALDAAINRLEDDQPDETPPAPDATRPGGTPADNGDRVP